MQKNVIIGHGWMGEWSVDPYTILVTSRSPKDATRIVNQHGSLIRLSH
jgi:hypothetical protein